MLTMLFAHWPVLFCETSFSNIDRDCSTFPPFLCVFNVIFSTAFLIEFLVTDGFASEILVAIFSINCWLLDPNDRDGEERALVETVAEYEEVGPVVAPYATLLLWI